MFENVQLAIAAEMSCTSPAYAWCQAEAGASEDAEVREADDRTLCIRRWGRGFDPDDGPSSLVDELPYRSPQLRAQKILETGAFLRRRRLPQRLCARRPRTSPGSVSRATEGREGGRRRLMVVVNSLCSLCF